MLIGDTHHKGRDSYEVLSFDMPTDNGTYLVILIFSYDGTTQMTAGVCLSDNVPASVGTEKAEKSGGARRMFVKDDYLYICEDCINGSGKEVYQKLIRNIRDLSNCISVGKPAE